MNVIQNISHAIPRKTSKYSSLFGLEVKPKGRKVSFVSWPVGLQVQSNNKLSQWYRNFYLNHQENLQ